MPIGHSPSRSCAVTATHRQVTPESFAVLLAALGYTPQESAAHYEGLRSKLIFFFMRRSLQSPDDLADEALDRLTYRLSEGVEIVSIDAFALGIARHIAQEQTARMKQIQTVDADYLANVPAPEPTQDREEEIVCMERCLKELPAEEADLLRKYYLADGSSLIFLRKQLAEDLGVSPTTLRQRVFLARQHLHACVVARLGGRSGLHSSRTAGKGN